MADRYSFSLTTFSPTGKLMQIEYALEAVNLGVTAIGIKATDGIVLATEKKAQSTLEVGSSNVKISRITPNTGMVYAGMGTDYRILVDKARKVSHSNYKRIYMEDPPTRILVQDIAKVMQEATQSGGVRPYGASLLVAGWDEDSKPSKKKDAESETSGDPDVMDIADGTPDQGAPSLYQVDPSGSYYPWKATAIGNDSARIKTFLEKRYTDTMVCQDAVHIALLALKESVEGDINGDTIEIVVIGPPVDDLLTMHGVSSVKAPRFRVLTPTDINDALASM